MLKILVTGCAGFIGSHLCEKLLEDGYSVVGIDNFDDFYSKTIKIDNMKGYINNPNFIFFELDITKRLISKLPQNIDIVVHLAGKAGVLPSIDYSGDYLASNVFGTHQVLEYMRNCNIKKLIFASSSSVYGNNKSIPFKETDNVDNPISPYAFTKKACELLNYTYHGLYNIDVINLRFFTVFGPRQRPDLAIHKFLKRILNDEQLILYGDGNSARDYTYITDTISGISNAIYYCISKNKFFLTLNLGNNLPIKLIDMVRSLYKLTGRAENYIHESMQAGDVDITYADITLAKQVLDYFPKTSFNEGLLKFIFWFVNQNETPQPIICTSSAGLNNNYK